MDRARSLREEASGAIAGQVEGTLYQAQRVLEDVEIGNYHDEDPS